jgi:hypothetical protein
MTFDLVEFEVTLQLTVSQSACQGFEPTVELVTRYYFLSEGCCLKVAVLSVLGSLSVSRTESLLFIASSTSIVLRRLSRPRSKPLIPRKSGSAGNLTRTSGSVARNSDH